jgi:hypothetical protein
MEGDRDQCQIQLGKWSQGESNDNEVKKKPSKELAYFIQGLGLGD